MNERIYEFAKQAGFIEDDDGNNLHVFDGYEAITCTEELSKFADEIVKECLRIVSKNTYGPSGEYDYGYGDEKAAADDRANAIYTDIKDHFGVK
jgi:hypothetical protein